MSESPVLHLDRERARDDLQVELAAVAGADVVEAVVAVGDHPGEDVEPPGRALRVRLRPHVLGQVQLLDQRHQVGPVALEHGAVAQVDPLEGEALDLLLDGRVDVGQEGAAQRPGEVAEAQVDARRLHRLGPDPVVAGADPLRLDRLVQRLRGEDAARSARSSRGDYSPRLLRAQVGGQRELEDLRKKLAQPLGFAGEHAPAEQRGDAADDRLVGRLGHFAARPAPAERPSRR